ncbi:MAG: hypothetical protein L3J47_09515, partial [Sulfurovum sp.]|nr:hypothetical protein [Sulfurovum sp.]
MIYDSKEQAIADLRWLLSECSVPPFSNSKLSSFEKQILEEELQAYDDDAILGFYEELLGMKLPVWEEHIDERELPVFALIPGEGGRVVLERTPEGLWKSEGRDGIRKERYFPKNTRFAPLKEERREIKKRSASEMFKEIALQHKTVLIHAAIASLSINILTLAVSFFSMQVYDRVVPTQGISTLIALTIGVFIAIFLGFLLKLSRSYILDEASADMDIAYAHEVFSRFLTIRPDAMPRSVGTLSGQLQSYATVRSFISSA